MQISYVFIRIFGHRSLFNTDFPLTKAALTVLNEHWPMAIDQDRLMRAACQRLDENYTSDNTLEEWQTVRQDLLHCYSLNIAEFHTWQAAFNRKVSAHPKVSRLAAYQNARGQTIANQRHERVTVDEIGKELIRILDGKQGHKALREHLDKCVEEGALVIRQDGVLLTDQTLVRQTLSNALAQTLKKLAGGALLEE